MVPWIISLLRNCMSCSHVSAHPRIHKAMDVFMRIGIWAFLFANWHCNCIMWHKVDICADACMKCVHVYRHVHTYAQVHASFVSNFFCNGAGVAHDLQKVCKSKAVSLHSYIVQWMHFTTNSSCAFVCMFAFVRTNFEDSLSTPQNTIIS